MQKRLSILNYSSARQFVLDSFAEKSRMEADFSIRKIARRAGLSNHVPLLLILQGKRRLHPRHVEWLTKILELSESEALHLQMLILKDRSQSPKEMQLFLDFAKQVNQFEIKQKNTLEIEYVEITRDPIHGAILSASQTKKGISSVKDLSNLFGHLFSTIELTSAVERLLRVGLLNFDGEKLVCGHPSTHSGNDRNQDAVKNYHHSVLQLVDKALKNQEMQDREFQGMALTVPEGKVVHAKALIRKFLKDFEKEMESETGDSVHQISLQFIRLSASPSVQTESEIESHPAQSAVQTARSITSLETL